MNDNAKKKKISFNVFDVFVILVVLILIVSAGYKIYSGISRDKSSDDGEYLLSFECISEYDSMIKYISEGDAVYIKATGELLGYIYKDAKSDASNVIFIIEATESTPDAPAEDESEAASENIIQSDEKPDMYTLVDFGGKLKLNGNTEKSREGDYYSIEGFNVTVGSEIEVYTEKTEFTIKVKQLTNIDE